MFLDELPKDGRTNHRPVGQRRRPPRRSSTGAAAARRRRAGTTPGCGRDAPIPPAEGGSSGGKYAEGMLVRHGTYGQGRVTEVSGQGALRKVKIRFASAGERTFIADKVTLEILRKG